jgi:hypothetical protein
MSFQERLKVFEEFRSAKNKILSPEDYTEVVVKDKRTGEVKKRKIILKSGWRKIKLFFGISSEILELKREKDEDKIIYICKAKVFTQSGMSAEAVGICSSDEPGKANMSEYVLSSIAQTRAINKAIADLVGADFDEDEEIAGNEDDFSVETSVSSSARYSHERRYEDKEKTIEYNQDLSLPDKDRTEIISRIFEIMKTLGDYMSRQEVFSGIKQVLGIDKNAQIKITDLKTSELKKVLSFLESELSKKSKKSNQEIEYSRGKVVDESSSDENFF